MIIPTNVSVTDFCITQKGNLDDVVSVMNSFNFSGINQDISGIEVDSFWDTTNTFSVSLRQDNKKIVALLDRTAIEFSTSGSAFTIGFDLGFES
jgi:hypothetical protein